MSDARRILALDTSTKSQNLALVRHGSAGGEGIARRLTRVRTNHSASLLANIDDMLEQAGWTPASIDLVAVGLGPGTFTGLRVGLATAKAFARANEAAIVGVSSLAATARPLSALFDGTVFALCDARRGEVYCASFSMDGGNVTTLTEAHAATPDTVRGYVLQTEGPVALIGNGLRAFGDLQTWERDDVTVMSQPWDGPSSVSVALLAAAKLDSDGPDDLNAMEPDYVRPSDAEMNFGPPDSREAKLK